MSDRRLGAGLTAVIVAAALTGCGDGGGASSSPPTAADTIEIVDFDYRPGVLSAKAGAELTVVNKDAAPHTLTFDDDSIDSKELKKGQSFTFTAPAKAGSYTYICDIHQYMKGRVEVTS